MQDDKDQRKLAEQTEHTADFKEQIEAATKAAAEQIAFWREFYKVWMPGGFAKRKRFRTKGHGLRRSERRKNNKVARIARRANRRPKKRRN